MKITKEITVEIDLSKLRENLHAMRVPDNVTFVLDIRPEGRFEFSADEWNTLLEAAELGLVIMEREEDDE